MTTVTTTSIAVTAAGQGALALLVTITLIALLVMKDISDGRESMGARRSGRILAIAIIPLLTVFAIDVVRRALDILK